MGWGASNREIVARIQAWMVKCRTCKNCKLIPKKPGDRLQQNDCTRQPMLIFFTDAPHQCRYHSDVEWRIRKGFNY